MYEKNLGQSNFECLQIFQKKLISNEYVFFIYIINEYAVYNHMNNKIELQPNTKKIIICLYAWKNLTWKFISNFMFMYYCDLSGY